MFCGPRLFANFIACVENLAHIPKFRTKQPKTCEESVKELEPLQFFSFLCLYDWWAAKMEFDVDFSAPHVKEFIQKQITSVGGPLGERLSCIFHQ